MAKETMECNGQRVLMSCKDRHCLGEVIYSCRGEYEDNSRTPRKIVSKKDPAVFRYNSSDKTPYSCDVEATISPICILEGDIYCYGQPFDAHCNGGSSEMDKSK